MKSLPSTALAILLCLAASTPEAVGRQGGKDGACTPACTQNLNNTTINSDLV